MNVVSLFAGCGGLDLGFERAGFKVIWANEFDETLHATYRFNHPNTILNTNDIRELTGADIPDCDGIIGGPPCQSWSEGGMRRGIEDSRGLLFLDFIRIVKDKKPKFFVIENVQGILEEKHKDSLSGFIALLKDAGYIITFELLNAADYKVPQDRFRVFFVGIRDDLKNKYEFPDAVCSTPINMRQAIGDIIEEPRFFKNEIVDAEHPMRMNHDVYTGPYDAKYMSRNRVRTWDEPSFTIQAQARNAPQHPQAPKMTFLSSSKRTFAKGFEHRYRRLSVRECARIQTFPDNFRFIYSDVKVGYKMVGNAVPPRLAWFLAMQMKKAFSYEDRGEKNKKETRQIPVCKIAETYPDAIVVNQSVAMQGGIDDYIMKRVLISLVRSDTIAYFGNQSAKLYYTGKNFPSSVSIDGLYFFMPYLKGKGIRDLYYIKIVRVGTKQEVHPECDDNALRLVFEIEFVKQLYTNYQPVHLNIWHTYTDTTIASLLKVVNNEVFG